MEEIIIKAKDGLELSCLYSKVNNAKACVQIVHGMVEHKERYIPFIERLNREGYTVIISDLRGHGKSINDKYPLGHIGSYNEMIDDQYEVTKFIKNDNVGLKLYMFAHSMGSLIGRNYLIKYDNEIEKLILCGTVSYNTGVGFAVFLGKIINRIKGKYKYSKLLYFFSNNASFDEDVSWISTSKKNVIEYQNDPLCGFKFDNFSNLNLFIMDNNLKKKNLYGVKNKNLEILSVSGALDRTTSGTKGLNKVMKLLNSIGYKNTSFIEYPNMRHEILNEEANECVYVDIVNFYNK